jgi:DNA polymerase/3'-5' exonuclease PolX
MIYNDIIIDNLEILNEYAKINGEVFKSRAYIKVIDELLNDNNSIKKYEDFLKIESAGDKIKAKVKELIETGKIKEVEEIKKDPLYIFKQNLLSIHGLGPVKINEIINNHKITSIEELKKNTQLLNSKQLIGLKYYDDLNKRISSIEIKVHHNILDDELKKYKNIEYDYVGSFRRGLKKMGDIDILIKKDANFNLTNFINDLKTKNYIIEILALGEHKFMGICKINKKKPARRIDITIAPEDEYYFTLLYFTGSKKFNIGMRTFARKLGYSLSEHGLSQIVNNKIPKINSENDIFKFLNLKYIEPKNRKDFSKIKYN